jgi:hypothetical protein
MGFMFAGVSMLFSNEMPQYYGIYIHTGGALVAFITIILAQWLVWQKLGRSDALVWGRYRAFSLVCSLLSTVLFFVFLITMKAPISGPYQGLTERLFMAVPLIWIGVSGIKLLTLSNPS